MSDGVRAGDAETRTVGAVVVVHGSNPYLAECLDSLQRQCDAVVVVDNLPDSETAALLADDGLVVQRNARPKSFAANVNVGVNMLDTDYVAIVNPDAVADAGCVDALVEFAAARAEGAIVAPQLRWPDGRPQPTGRSFPTPGATLLRRTPLRRVFSPTDRQRQHYRLDRQQATDPWEADWLLGAFLVLRRADFASLGGMDTGYRMYVEDMDLCARASERAVGRWVVPAATAVHEYQAVIDRRYFSRRNWWHVRGMARFLRRHWGKVVGRRS